MDTIKKSLILLFITPFLSFGQKSIYPKDTLYIYHDNLKQIKRELNHPKFGKSIFFKNFNVFYNYEEQADTLCMRHLKDYNFSKLKEINKWKNGFLTIKDLLLAEIKSFKHI